MCSPPIEVYTQAAQSADHNINDHAFFRALACAVRKLRKGKVSFDLDKLADDVEAAYHDYPTATLAKMWEYLEYGLRATLDTNPPGGNDYARHRPRPDKGAEKRGRPRKQ